MNATKTATKTTKNVQITSPDRAYQELRNIQGKIEQFVILLLDSENNILNRHQTAVGDEKCVEVSLRNIFRLALNQENCAGFIAAHNHPSGNITPSEADFIVTEKLIATANLLELTMVDHIIIGTGDYFSFRDSVPSLFEEKKNANN